MAVLRPRNRGRGEPVRARKRQPFALGVQICGVRAPHGRCPVAAVVARALNSRPLRCPSAPHPQPTHPPITLASPAPQLPSLTSPPLHPAPPKSPFNPRRVLPSLFTLKERRYLGPTSMDAEMAFVMANMVGRRHGGAQRCTRVVVHASRLPFAPCLPLPPTPRRWPPCSANAHTPCTHPSPQAWARPGSLVFDPYCGTGSLLVAAARLGAYVIGGDIDMRVLKVGKRNQKTGDPEDNFSNFSQYGLQWPAGLLRMDASRPPWRRGLREVRRAAQGCRRAGGASPQGGSGARFTTHTHRTPQPGRITTPSAPCKVFDAIIGDPPYGVRAGGRKSHAKQLPARGDRDTHLPSTAPYGLTECVDDLAAMAARMLAPGARGTKSDGVRGGGG